MSRRVTFEVTAELDDDIDQIDMEDLMYSVLAESDRLRRAGVDVQGCTIDVSRS
jgi:hypothetical protein